MVQDVSNKLVDQFAECIKSQLSAVPEERAGAVQEAQKPVSGLSLALTALVGAIKRLFGFGRERGDHVRRISVTVNGVPREADVEERDLLVYFLREGLGLTGTNVGCDTTVCRACTVHVDGESVKSCNLLAVQVDGAEVTTIEGLATNGEMHPMQAAFQEHHGLQCGFCTPGMIMAAVGVLNENPSPSEDEIRHGLEGNLCRCTGYHNIVKAVAAVASA